MVWKRLTVTREETEAGKRLLGKKSRFLVDENLMDLASALRELGYNVKTVGELGLTGHEDEDIFAAAYRDDRILVTQDRDFIDDRRFPRHRNPGIVVLLACTEAELTKSLVLTLPEVGPNRELFRGSKVIVSGDGTTTVLDTDSGGQRCVSKYRHHKGRWEEWQDEEDA